MSRKDRTQEIQGLVTYVGLGRNERNSLRLSFVDPEGVCRWLEPEACYSKRYKNWYFTQGLTFMLAVALKPSLFLEHYTSLRSGDEEVFRKTRDSIYKWHTRLTARFYNQETREEALEEIREAICGRVFTFYWVPNHGDRGGVGTAYRFDLAVSFPRRQFGFEPETWAGRPVHEWLTEIRQDFALGSPLRAISDCIDPTAHNSSRVIASRAGKPLEEVEDALQEMLRYGWVNKANGLYVKAQEIPGPLPPARTSSGAPSVTVEEEDEDVKSDHPAGIRASMVRGDPYCLALLWAFSPGQWISSEILSARYFALGFYPFLDAIEEMLGRLTKADLVTSSPEGALRRTSLGEEVCTVTEPVRTFKEKGTYVDRGRVSVVNYHEGMISDATLSRIMALCSGHPSFLRRKTFKAGEAGIVLLDCGHGVYLSNKSEFHKRSRERMKCFACGGSTPSNYPVYPLRDYLSVRLASALESEMVGSRVLTDGEILHLNRRELAEALREDPNVNVSQLVYDRFRRRLKSPPYMTCLRVLSAVGFDGSATLTQIEARLRVFRIGTRSRLHSPEGLGSALREAVDLGWIWVEGNDVYSAVGQTFSFKGHSRRIATIKLAVERFGRDLPEKDPQVQHWASLFGSYDNFRQAVHLRLDQMDALSKDDLSKQEEGGDEVMAATDSDSDVSSKPRQSGEIVVSYFKVAQQLGSFVEPLVSGLSPRERFKFLTEVANYFSRRKDEEMDRLLADTSLNKGT